MKLGLTTLIAAALAALLLVPAAGAKPGNGNGNGKGNGQGPPAWAGGSNAGAKPDRAAKQERKAAKEAAKAERRAARAQARAAGDDDDGEERLNPARTCRLELASMGPEAFAEEYGTNENKANAFGKCVSREAHERDGVELTDEEEPSESTGGEDVEEVPGSDDPADESETSTSVSAFFLYLWPYLHA